MNTEDINPRDMPPGTKIWGYPRFSPGDNQSIDSQKSAIERLAKQKGWVITRWFIDEGVSGGSTKNRKSFEYMIHLARQKPRQADMIVIWEFSRFARNQTDSQLYRAELRKNGWQLLSMKDDIPPGPMGKIFEALIDWKNEQFLIDLRANTRRGLRYIAEQGCVPNGPIAKGYTIQEKEIGVRKDGVIRMGRHPVIDPDVAPLVIKAFELKAGGAINAIIAEEVGFFKPASGSWHAFFRNRAYIGEFEFDDEIFTNIYPPIINASLFEAVQKCIPPKIERQRRFHPRRKGSSYFLANIAVCGYCNGPAEGKGVGKYRYYICAGHNINKANCPSAKGIGADYIEEQALDFLTRHMVSTPYLQELLDWTNRELGRGVETLRLQRESVERELAEAEKTAIKTARNFATMERPTRSTELLLREQDDLVENLKLRLAGLEFELANSRIEISEEQLKRFVSSTQTMLREGEYFDLREICEQLFSRIVMTSEECRFEVHFPAII